MIRWMAGQVSIKSGEDLTFIPCTTPWTTCTFVVAPDIGSTTTGAVGGLPSPLLWLSGDEAMPLLSRRLCMS